MREREPAGAAKGLGLGQAGLEIGFVGAEVGFGVCFCGLLGEGGGGVVVVEGGEGGGVAGARWGEGEDRVDVFDCVEGLLGAGGDGEPDGEIGVGGHCVGVWECGRLREGVVVGGVRWVEIVRVDWRY